MSIVKSWIISLLNPKTYIWVDVLPIREPRKAILIEFDGKRAWFPKAWIAKIKRDGYKNTIKIKASEYDWAQKF